MYESSSSSSSSSLSLSLALSPLTRCPLQNQVTNNRRAAQERYWCTTIDQARANVGAGPDVLVVVFFGNASGFSCWRGAPPFGVKKLLQTLQGLASNPKMNVKVFVVPEPYTSQWCDPPIAHLIDHVVSCIGCGSKVQPVEEACTLYYYEKRKHFENTERSLPAPDVLDERIQQTDRFIAKVEREAKQRKEQRAKAKAACGTSLLSDSLLMAAAAAPRLTL